LKTLLTKAWLLTLLLAVAFILAACGGAGGGQQGSGSGGEQESAIEMAQVAYRESDNPEIRTLAEGIVEAQVGEITRMEGWRQQWYPEG
jgi:hypothetical protein